MLISQRKRATYDERGAIEKLDILHSIRRKQSTPTIMQERQPDSEEKQGLQKKSTLASIIRIVQIALIVLIAISLLFLFKNIVASFSQNQKIAAPQSNMTQSQLMNNFIGFVKYKGQIDLKEFKMNNGLTDEEWMAFMMEFANNLECRIGNQVRNESYSSKLVCSFKNNELNV